MSLGQPWGEWQWFSEMWWAERGPSMRLPRLETGQLLEWGWCEACQGLQGHGVLPAPRVMSHESVNMCCQWSQVSLVNHTHSPRPVLTQCPQRPQPGRMEFLESAESGRPLDLTSSHPRLSDLPSFGSNIWFISWATQLNFSLSRVSFLPAVGLSITLESKPYHSPKCRLLHTTVRSFPSWEGWRLFQLLHLFALPLHVVWIINCVIWVNSSHQWTDNFPRAK